MLFTIRPALLRIEELLPFVIDETPIHDRKAIELKIMSDIVIEYEESHFPIGNPSLADVVKILNIESSIILGI